MNNESRYCQCVLCNGQCANDNRVIDKISLFTEKEKLLKMKAKEAWLTLDIFPFNCLCHRCGFCKINFRTLRGIIDE